MKMEQTECSETSAYKLQTPGNYPEENIEHTEHGESLKSKIFHFFPQYSQRNIGTYLEIGDDQFVSTFFLFTFHNNFFRAGGRGGLSIQLTSINTSNVVACSVISMEHESSDA
jgi:hypothetical protein